MVEIDPEGTLDAARGVARRIPEQGRMAVDVREMPVLDLTLIPFLWSEAPDTRIVTTIDAVAANPERHPLLFDTRTLLPVSGLNVTAHEPVVTATSDDLGLLAQTRTIRIMERGNGHYVGMMSGTMTGSDGRGERPGHVSVAQPYAPTIAHELGHNMNLMHAPCGNPSGIDPAYPHADGTIGDWGYDYWQSLLAPWAYRDPYVLLRPQVDQRLSLQQGAPVSSDLPRLPARCRAGGRRLAGGRRRPVAAVVGRRGRGGGRRSSNPPSSSTPRLRFPNPVAARWSLRGGQPGAACCFL